jgi:hypothetical protein
MNMDWKQAHEELVTHARRRAKLDHDECHILLAALRSEAHLALGYGSFYEYVERYLGYAPRYVEERLRVAEALEELPLLSTALRDHTLTWSAVREITRIACPENENEWIDTARNRTAREVERLVADREPGDRPSTPAKPQARRHILRFEVSAEAYATFREATAKIRRDVDEPLDDSALLLAMSRHILAGPSDAGRASYQISLTVCEACGSGHMHGKGELVTVSPAIVDAATCDAQILPQAVTESGAIDRATQTIPPAIRREVHARHHGRCAVPGCRLSTFLDCHHINLRSEGGTHDPETMILLCGVHHAAQHDGRLQIDGRYPTGFTFRHADGSFYGSPPSPTDVENHTLAFQALRSLGLKESEARRALALASATPHVGANLEALIKTALSTWYTNRNLPEPANDGSRVRTRRFRPT